MKILNFGSLNIDYVYKLDHIIIKGETQLADSRSTFSGGKGLNQSVAMGKAGLPVYHAGNIGVGGEFLLEELQSAGVNTEFVRILEDTPSGHTVIQNSADGDNCIILFGGANQAVTREQVDTTLAAFENGDYLVLQNEINEMPYIMEQAHKKGMVIVLNPSPMDKKIADLPLEYADYIMLNEIEAAQVLAMQGKKAAASDFAAAPQVEDAGNSAAVPQADAADELIAALPAAFPKAKIVLTLGSDGSVYLGGGEPVRQSIYKVKAVDTTAAGDTFTGYFLAGIIEGLSPAEALDLASRASSIAVSRPGAAPSIPTMAEVRG